MNNFPVADVLTKLFRDFMNLNPCGSSSAPHGCKTEALISFQVINAICLENRDTFAFLSRHRQFIKDFLDDRFAGLLPRPGFPLAAGNVRCHLVVMSNAQLLSRITMDADICHGKPCIRGLRYPVEFLLELLSGDMTEPQILADYPDLEAADLRAAIAYAARLSRIKRIEPVAA
jgi:uncharacterized protein (DUF433 family)